MEGVMDVPLRALMAEAGGFDFAVSEFVRVSGEAIPAKAIARQIPELREGFHCGRAALPIQVQLLGQRPALMAETAIEACIAGAKSIDLNFGCPSPQVIRKNGGSALLREPKKIFAIVDAVRRGLPSSVPVSAKIRLGWDDASEVDVIARAAADGGANWLTIHARTRAEFYRPGVHWESVRRAADALRIPVVANGDLFSEKAFEDCRQATGCIHFMIGRGALLDPFLARKISFQLGLVRPEPALTETFFAEVIRRFIEIAEPFAQNNGYTRCRVKQWIGILRSIDVDRVPKHVATAIGRGRTSEELIALLAKDFRKASDFAPSTVA